MVQYTANATSVDGVTVTGTPTSGQVITATSATAANWQAGVSLPLATLGDTLYENATPAPAALAGNTTTTKKFLTQTGTGTVSAAPAWNTVVAADLPGATTSTQGAVILDGTASDIQAVGTAAAAGSVGKAADAGHVHAGLSLVAATGAGGYTLVNGTGTVISWSVPNDGQRHRFMLVYSMDITVNETGGAISVVFTSPGSTAVTYGILPGSQTAGWNFGEAPAFCSFAKPGTTVSISQTSALTAGAAVLTADIWGL